MAVKITHRFLRSARSHNTHHKTLPMDHIIQKVESTSRLQKLRVSAMHFTVRLQRRLYLRRHPFSSNFRNKILYAFLVHFIQTMRLLGQIQLQYCVKATNCDAPFFRNSLTYLPVSLLLHRFIYYLFICFVYLWFISVHDSNAKLYTKHKMIGYQRTTSTVVKRNASRL